MFNVYRTQMQTLRFDRHRFPPDIIRYAVWLYAKPVRALAQPLHRYRR
jgi:hypothetical protein